MRVAVQCPPQSGFLLFVQISLPAGVRYGLAGEVGASGGGEDISNGPLHRGYRDALVLRQIVGSEFRTVNYNPTRFFASKASTFGNCEMNLGRVNIGEPKN